MLLPAALLALPLLFVACGDDDDEPTPTPSQSGTQAAGTQPSGGTPGNTGPTPTVESVSTPGDFTGGTDPVKVDAPASAGVAVLRNVRSAAQNGFDRIVFEFEGTQVPGYSVQYQDEAIACGSGEDLTEFIGNGSEPPAMLVVDLRPAASHDDNGQQTAARDLNVKLATITRAFRICDFEAVVDYAVATTAKKPFKVTTLQDPPRLVIDIAQ
jgi:hypothetical protein